MDGLDSSDRNKENEVNDNCIIYIIQQDTKQYKDSSIRVTSRRDVLLP